MGVFDHVNFRMGCPHCGATVEGFQTKDGDVCMKTVEPESVLTFYSACDACHRWIELTRAPGAGEALHREIPLTLREVQALGFRLVEAGSGDQG